MKAAVAHLEPFMEKSESATKGTVVLATVKGDVHDIGKNLVEIILGNNGFRVINLGIKVPPEDLIKAHREHRPDLIGLSGLLVKSAQQMVVTAEDLKAAGVRCPVLVGGAALSAKFTAAKIAPAYASLVCYANDAMAGLDLANKLMSEETREAMAAKAQAEEKAARLRERVAAVENEVLANGTMPARAVFKFFPAQSEGDAVLLYGPGHQVVETFTFPRQSTGEGLCLADFVAPRSTGVTDYVALFAVTCGGGVRELAERWKAEGRFLDSHIVQALAIEGAERSE